MSVLHQIALTLIPGIGSVLARQLITYCGSAEAVFSESKSNLLKIPNIGSKIAQTLKQHPEVLVRAEEELTFMQRNNIKAYLLSDKEYPERLKNCPDAPIVLFFKGNADLNKLKVVNIIGSRKASDYGKEIVNQVLDYMKPYDPLIVSGLAYGIDVLAHKEAMNYGLFTVGVLGHGLDVLYPAIHRSVADKMLENGGLLTEFTSKTPVHRLNFPKRNRIVAGMCDATIVVEAGVKSGSIITAELALDYSKEVFAFPGRITDENYAGCNKLIKNNIAQLVTSGEDIVNALGWELKEAKTSSKSKNISSFADLPPDEQKIIALIINQKVITVDDISIGTKFAFGHLSKLLLNLELKGIIKQLPGKAYAIS